MAGAQLARAYAPPGSRISAAFGAPLSLDPYSDARLRREQADFERTRREISRQNAWMAVPALAPVGAALGLEVLGAASARSAATRLAKAPLNFLQREAWQKGPKVVPRPLDEVAKAKIRADGREAFERAYGIKARDMGAHVHHTPSLQFAHVTPYVNPNRLSGLQALQPPHHQIPNYEWAAFARSLRGRNPTPAELMAAKIRIDRMVEPYVLRRGISRPSSHPKQPLMRPKK